jgi:uncharacterized membrane protein
MAKKKSTKKLAVKTTIAKSKSVSKKTTKKSHNTSIKKASPKKVILPIEVPKEETPLHYNRRWCAALSYLLVGVIWYFLDEKMKRDDFVKFHVKQGLVLLISILALQVLSTLMILLTFLWFVIGLFLLIIGLIGVVYALENKEKPMPILGKYAKNFTF